jgi:chromosome segregation ATPase
MDTIAKYCREIEERRSKWDEIDEKLNYSRAEHAEALELLGSIHDETTPEYQAADATIARLSDEIDELMNEQDEMAEGLLAKSWGEA